MIRGVAQILACGLIVSSAAMADEPSPEMMVPVKKIADFIVTADNANLSAFASHNVVIVENFAPYVFVGPDAVQRWAEDMRAHAKGLDGLAYRFGPAQNFSITGDRAYFSLPTQWTGRAQATSFVEDGGWSFVLVNENGSWRVLAYGWSVTRLEPSP